MTTSNEIGNDLEEYAASVLAGSRVVQSGGGKFLKLDVKDKTRFVYSCKATKQANGNALARIARLWREAVKGARGVQGHGDGAKPGMIFEVGGEVLICHRIEDYAEVAMGNVEGGIEPSRGDERRARAGRSPMDA